MAIIDLRLDVGFADHPKTFQLAAFHPSAPLCLIRLWSWCRLHRTDGLLHGLGPPEVEQIARWQGQPGALWAELLRLGWIDIKPLSIHDWTQHQPYSCGTRRRSKQGKRAAQIRWDQHFNADSNAVSNARSNADSNAPSPYPSPQSIESQQTDSLTPPAPETVAAGELLFAPRPSGKTRSQLWASGFAEWWKLYLELGRSEGKAAARRAWAALMPRNGNDAGLDALYDRIMDETERQGQAWREEARERRLIPHAATFLRREEFRG